MSDVPVRATASQRSGSWSPPSISLPGSFRRTKTRIMGPKIMADDPLGACRAEIDEYDSLLSVLGSCALTLQAAIDMLAAAPVPMCENLQNVFPRGGEEPGAELVYRLSEKTSMFAARIKKGDSHITTILDTVNDLRQTNTSVKDQFKMRDDTWMTHQHYSSKVLGLQDQFARRASTNGSETRAAKVNRNQQKLQEAEQAFNQSMGQTAKQAHDVLELKWTKVGQTLSKLCRFYVVIFDGADQMVRDLGLLAEELMQGCSSEDDWVKKAQAMGHKARDRMSGAATSAREKLDSMRGPYSVSKVSGGEEEGNSPSSSQRHHDRQSVSAGSGASGIDAPANDKFDNMRESFAMPWPAPSSPGPVHRADPVSSGGGGTGFATSAKDKLAKARGRFSLPWGGASGGSEACAASSPGTSHAPASASGGGGSAWPAASPWDSMSSNATSARGLPAETPQSGDPFTRHQASAFGSGYFQPQTTWPQAATGTSSSGMPSPWGPAPNAVASAQTSGGSPWDNAPQKQKLHLSGGSPRDKGRQPVGQWTDPWS